MNATVEEKTAAGYSKFPNAVIDSGLLALMKGSELKVYAVILRHAHYSSRQSFPSINGIIKESGTSRRHIQASIKALLSYGLIEKHRFRSGLKFKCVYTIKDNPEIAPPIKPQKVASWEGRNRDDSGKFSNKPQKVASWSGENDEIPDDSGVKPQKVTSAIKPQKVTNPTSHERWLVKRLKETERDSDQKSDAPPAPSRGSGSVLNRPEPSPVSTDLLRKMSKELGKAKTLAYLRSLRPNQLVPDFLLGDGGEGVSPERKLEDPQPAPRPGMRSDEEGRITEGLANDSREIREDSRKSHETNPLPGPLGVSEIEGKGALREGNSCVA